jgi:hypothetical protein
MDVQRTGLVIAVSNGAPNITGSKVYRCPEDRPSNRCLRWSPKINGSEVYGCPEDMPHAALALAAG